VSTVKADAYDLVVIGSGPAGLSAAELAAFLGHSVLIIERSHIGGAVATTGGAPTKTIREVAFTLASEWRRAGDENRAQPSLAEALPIIRSRTADACRTLQRVIAGQLEAKGISVVYGLAQLASNRVVAITQPGGDRFEVTARTIVLATGSKPVRFTGVPFEDPDVYDSNEIFRMQRSPRDIVIVGGGPVGVEFATIFAALDVPVTLIDQSERLLPSMDLELVQEMSANLEQRGARLLLGTGVADTVRRDDHLTVTLSSGARLETDAVLFAAGRIANTEGLGLDRVGVEVDRRGRIAVDRYYRTTCPGIYAVGDAVGPTLASVATQQGRAAVCHAFGLAFGVPVDRAPSAAVYGLPELAGVGATEEQIRSSGAPYVVGRCDLSETARGAIAGRGGRLKLIVRADDRKLLGVHCIGDIASELVGMGHAVLHMGGAVDVFLTLALNTPTYCSAYRDAAIDAMRQLAALAGHPSTGSIARPHTTHSSPLSALHARGDLS
jgi:NAD(P) transhydrogenase